MPRVHYIKKARKDNPCCKAGESYYFWEFRYGGKRYSKTRPRQSQLTQSAYYGALYSLQEQIEDYSVHTADDLETLVDDARSGLEELRDEQEEKIQNMSEHGLEYTPSGELVQERLDALENAISEIENIDLQADEDFNDEEMQEFLDNAKSEITDAIGECHV